MIEVITAVCMLICIVCAIVSVVVLMVGGGR
jgi:hypothetical protein